MTDDKLYYLATPYTNFGYGHTAAFAEAARCAADLIRQGVNVYSPIVHSHPIAELGGLDPVNHDLWMGVDRAFMERCDGIIVATMKGWDSSKGVMFEIDWFTKAGKSVRYYDPKTDTIANFM
ncbi:MAG: DUF1937 family protein [Aestuariivirga sp.]